MNSPIERHSTIGRNLNARDNAVFPHRHRFPGPGSMIAQSFISAHSYRNRLQCAAGGIIPCVKFRCNLINLLMFHNSLRTGISAGGRLHNEVRYDFGLPSLVPFFGGAKKGTDASALYQVASQFTERHLFSSRRESTN